MTDHNITAMPLERQRIHQIDNEVCVWLMCMQHGKIVRGDVMALIERQGESEQQIYRDRINHYRPIFNGKPSQEFSDRNWVSILGKLGLNKKINY